MIFREDPEIREVEKRLSRERHALARHATNLGYVARDALVSPRGLLAAAALGFVWGTLTRSRQHEKTDAPLPPPRSLSLGLGLVGGAVLALMKAQSRLPTRPGGGGLKYATELRAKRTAAAESAASTGDPARRGA